MHVLTLAGFLLPAPALPAPAVVPIHSDEEIAIVEVATTVAPDELFAPAKEALALAWPGDSEGLTVLDVVHAYGAVTGQRLSIQKDTREVLGKTLAPLDRATSVPQAEVQGFVEALLRSADCALTIDRLSEPRLIGVHSLQTQARHGLRARAHKIDSARVDVLRRHPAVLFSTIVEIPNVDARQVSNSMRTLITDANTSTMLPTGTSNAMVLVGFGSFVADRIDDLLIVNAAGERAKVAVSHEVIRLKNATAREIAPLVEKALSISRQLRTPRTQGNPGPGKSSPVHVSVLADGRLNGLLITCRSDDLEEARALIAQMDVK